MIKSTREKLLMLADKEEEAGSVAAGGPAIRTDQALLIETMADEIIRLSAHSKTLKNARRALIKEARTWAQRTKAQQETVDVIRRLQNSKHDSGSIILDLVDNLAGLGRARSLLYHVRADATNDESKPTKMVWPLRAGLHRKINIFLSKETDRCQTSACAEATDVALRNSAIDL